MPEKQKRKKTENRGTERLKNSKIDRLKNRKTRICREIDRRNKKG
mgnify:FL=1